MSTNSGVFIEGRNRVSDLLFRQGWEFMTRNPSFSVDGVTVDAVDKISCYDFAAICSNCRSAPKNQKSNKSPYVKFNAHPSMPTRHDLPRSLVWISGRVATI